MTKKFRLMLASEMLSLAALLAGFFVYSQWANAGSASLYPGSCLGSWQNPHLAQGRPEAQELQFINKENSAIFLEGGIKEIYCGSFNGDLSESEIKLIKNVNLKFSWLISNEELTTATSSIIIIQPSATSSEAVAQNTDYIVNQILNNIHADEISVIVSTTTPEITITTAASDAQQETSNLGNAAAIATSSPTSFWWKKYNFFFAEDQVSNIQQATDNTQQTTTITTTTTTFTSTATSSLDSPLAPSEDFLKVSYTLNGVDWQFLGTVNKNNWQDISFQIPVYQLEDVKKIQIKIESLPILNKTPYVYLDGMALEVEYDADNLGATLSNFLSSQQNGGQTEHFVSQFYNRNPNISTVSGPLEVNLNYNNLSDLMPSCQAQSATQLRIYAQACGDRYSFQPTINGAPTCLGGQSFLSQNFPLNQKSINASISLPPGDYVVIGYVCLDNNGNEIDGDNVESSHQEGFLTPILRVTPNAAGTASTTIR